MTQYIRESSLVDASQEAIHCSNRGLRLVTSRTRDEVVAGFDAFCFERCAFCVGAGYALHLKYLQDGSGVNSFFRAYEADSGDSVSPKPVPQVALRCRIPLGGTALGEDPPLAPYIPEGGVMVPGAGPSFRATHSSHP